MFTGIKVGDLVLAHSWIGSFHPIHNYYVCKVTDVKKKTFKVDKYPDKSFTIANGSVYGDTYCGRLNVLKYDEQYYNERMKEKAEEERRRDLLSKAKCITFERLTNEQLEKIVEIATPTEHKDID